MIYSADNGKTHWMVKPRRKLTDAFDREGHFTLLEVRDGKLTGVTDYFPHRTFHDVYKADEFQFRPFMKLHGEDEMLGHLYTFEQFRDLCVNGSFIDYDGTGHFARSDAEMDLRAKPSEITAWVEGRFNFSPRIATMIALNEITHVTWYNR